MSVNIKQENGTLKEFAGSLNLEGTTVVNDTTTETEGTVLDGRMGKILNDKIDSLKESKVDRNMDTGAGKWEELCNHSGINFKGTGDDAVYALAKMPVANGTWYIVAYGATSNLYFIFQDKNGNTTAQYELANHRGTIAL